MKRVTKMIFLVSSIVSAFLTIDGEKLLQKLKKEEEKLFENKKLPLHKYTSQKFDLAGKLKGFSKKQIEEHEQLYQGYVNKSNEIAEKLETADRSAANNATYSEFRELQLEKSFAHNGRLLHELYFHNMGAAGKTIGPKTKELLIKNFGSIDAFKEDLFATARSARGWAITFFSLDDGRVHNFLLESHNDKVPVLTIPLLVLDVYEHAYMIDFGIKRVPYLDVFWDNIDWNVVENRVIFVEKQAENWKNYFEMPLKK